MGAGTVISGMIRAFESNRNQFKQKRRPFNGKALEKRISNSGTSLKFREVSESQLRAIKENIRYNAQREKFRAILLIAVAAIILGFIAWIILF